MSMEVCRYGQKQIAMSVLTDVSYFICDGWISCRRYAGGLTLNVRSRSIVRRFVACKEEGVRAHTGLLLAMKADQEVRAR